MTIKQRLFTLAAIGVFALAQACTGDATKPVAPSPAAKPKPGRAAEQAKENSGRVKDIREKCSETSEEGKAIVEKVKAWNPVVNERPSDKSLGAIAEEYVSKGLYDICWGATRKTNGKWKIAFNHIDIQGAFQEAEWEHDPSTGETKPFNSKAMEFWYGKL